MSKDITQEIEEMAERMEKAAVEDPSETLGLIIKSMGPEALKAKMSDLNEEDKELLKAVLEEELEKAGKGEGSRGGKIVGHSKDGKPVYETGRNRFKAGAKEARKYDDQKKEKGVHVARMPYPNKKDSFGQSSAGYQAEGAALGGTPEHKPKVFNDAAKKEHKAKLKELKAMPKPNLTKAEEFEKAGKGEGSRGGKITGHTKSGKPIYEGDKHPHDAEEKGVHAVSPKYTPGKGVSQGSSHVGALVEGAARDKDKPKLRDYNTMKISAAKTRHEAKLQELKDMPKPNLTKAEEIEKAGEGSRGGKVVGHSKMNGKPLYAHTTEGKEHVSHKFADKVKELPTDEQKRKARKMRDEGTKAVGVHGDESKSTGYSRAGMAARGNNKEAVGNAKTMHSNKLKELKEMPKPNLTKGEELEENEMNKSRAVEFDKEAQSAKVIQGKITDTIIQEEIGSDDADEKLMKPEAAKHNHQGSSVEGWDGQVIKSLEDSEEALTELVAKAMDKCGGNSDLIMKKLKEKGMPESKVQGALDKYKASKEEVKKSDEIEKGKMSQDQAKTELMRMEQEEHGVKQPQAIVDAEKKEQSEKKKEMKIKKALAWEGDERLLKANTQGRNFNFNVGDYLEKSRVEEVVPETDLRKSDGKEDLNDIIEKSMDRTWDQVNHARSTAEEIAKKNGQLQKSFDDLSDLAKILGLTEEEAKKILG